MTDSKIQFRPYQKRDFDIINQYLDKGDSVMYQLPTGGGKSVVIAGTVEKHKTQRILFIAHRRELLFQMTKRLRDLKLKTGLIVGDIREEVDSNILIVSVQTLVRGQFDILLSQSWDIVIVDESHRFRTPSYDKVLDKMLEVNPKVKILGVTATPYRSDKLDFRKYIKQLVISDDIPTLIEGGFLAKSVTYSINIGDIDSEVIKNTDDYQIQSLSTYMRKPGYLQALVDLYKMRGEERQMLIFAVDKKHAQSILEVYQKNGYTKLGYIDADTHPDKREKILRDYEKKEVQIIVSIETMTEGVDLPDTGCIQCARPTESIVLYSQMNGRGMRLKSDGSNLIILDCAGNTQKHGTVTSPRHWSLDPNINPKLISKKNKVVGKRKDGTYTENIEELDYLELVEMSPEEYLVNISGNVEKAEGFNKEIEESIKKNTLTLAELILKKAKVTNFEPVIDKYDPDTVRFIECGENSKDTKYTIEIERRSYSGTIYEHQLIYSKPWRSRNDGAEDFKHLNFYITYLEIYKVVKFPEISKRIQEIKVENRELEKSKIDIGELNKKVLQFKHEQFFKELNFELGQSVEISFSKEESLSRNFRDLSGRFNRVVFDRPKLLSSHVVNFYRDTTITEKDIERGYYSKGQKAGDIYSSNMGSYNYMDRQKLLDVIYPLWESRVKQVQAIETLAI